MRPVSVSAPRQYPGGILLTAVFPTGEIAGFFATPNDVEEYGRELHARALAGEFGKIQPYEKPVRTTEELIREVRNLVTDHLNATARAKRPEMYDSIQTASLRAAYPGPFHDEGVAFAAWADTCWAKYYEIVAEINSGGRDIAEISEVLSELPALELP